MQVGQVVTIKDDGEQAGGKDAVVLDRKDIQTKIMLGGTNLFYASQNLPPEDYIPVNLQPTDGWVYWIKVDRLTVKEQS